MSDDLIPADVKDNYRRLVAEGGQTWATVAENAGRMGDERLARWASAQGRAVNVRLDEAPRRRRAPQHEA